MYIPEHFALTIEQAIELLTPVRGGDLVTTGPNGLAATFIPMMYVPGEGYGRLIGHVSKVNPQWKDAGEALFIVNGPDDYIDAAWLSRPEAVSVPTWNYVTVHAHGELIAHPEPEWMLQTVRELSLAQGDDTVTTMPEEAVEILLRSIVGVELRITKLVGKAKMSQNKSPEVIAQVIDGLAEAGNAEAADWMREHSLPRAEAKAALVEGIRREAKSAR